MVIPPIQKYGGLQPELSNGTTRTPLVDNASLVQALARPSRRSMNLPRTARRGCVATCHLLTRQIYAWRQELLALGLGIVVASAGYVFVIHSAMQAVESLSQSCAARFEIEWQDPENQPPPRALLDAVCRCLSRALLDRNGLWQLALVDNGWRHLQELEPVTEGDEAMCVDEILGPQVELARHRAKSWLLRSHPDFAVHK